MNINKIQNISKTSFVMPRGISFGQNTKPNAQIEGGDELLRTFLDSAASINAAKPDFDSEDTCEQTVSETDITFDESGIACLKKTGEPFTGSAVNSGDNDIFMETQYIDSVRQKFILSKPLEGFCEEILYADNKKSITRTTKALNGSLSDGNYRVEVIDHKYNKHVDEYYENGALIKAAIRSS